MDTWNGVTFCGSPPVSTAEQATNPMPQIGRMPQEAKALGNVRDTLTWGGYMGSLRQWKDEGFMTGVFDALKTAEYNQSSAVQPEQETSRDSLFVVVLMTTAHMLRSRMRRKFHVRFCTGGGVGNHPADRNGWPLWLVIAPKAS